MKEKAPRKNAGKPAESREDRLKSALKANLARRKAQVRARKPEDAGSAAGKDKG